MIELSCLADFSLLSRPGTVETLRIVAELKKDGYDVRVRVRKSSEGRGLSSAVLLGLQQEAKYNVLLCMDADLQHEPESVPDVLRPILQGVADFSVVHFCYTTT